MKHRIIVKRIQDYINLLILLLTGILIVFYQFNDIPKNISFDEVEFAKLALSLQDSSYTVYSPLATGHSTLYFYILLFSLNQFGVSAFALRLPSAIFGVINGILIYLVLQKTIKNKSIAFIGAFIFLTLRWYFNFARFSFEATFLLFLELSSLYFMMNLTKEQEKKYFNYSMVILSAVFAGLAFHSYYPGRLFFILPAIWLILKSQKKYLLIYFAVSGIIIAPLVLYNIQHPDVRVSQISFISDPKLSLDYKIRGILANIVNTILMPFTNGDMNGRHNFPGKAALNPITALILLMGIYLSMKEVSGTTVFFLVYLVLGIVPTILTSPTDNPNMLRTFTVIPSIVYFIATAIKYALYRASQSNYSKVLSLLLFVIILISSAYELRTYFMFQSRVFKNSFEVVCPLKDLINESIVPKKCRVQKNMF